MESPEALKRRIKKLEAELDAAKKAAVKKPVANGDGDVEQLMALAEKALLDKEELQLVIERQKQTISDLQLKNTVDLLEKEVELAALQADMAAITQLKKSGADKDSVIEQLQGQIYEYRLAFDSLKEMCVESATTCKSAEAQLDAQIRRTHELESQLNECHFLLKEHSASLQSFQQMAVVDQELIQRSQEVEKHYRSSLDAKERELASYKEAFERLSKIAIEKESARVSEVAGLKAKALALEETVRRNATFLAPRWQRLVDEKAANKIGSKAAALLRARDTETSSLMLQAEKRFFVSCIPPGVWSTETHVYNVGLSLARLVYKADNFLEYIFEAHYVELIADVESNPRSVQKDKGFLRWLHNSVSIITAIISKSSELLEGLRCATLDDVKEYLISTSPPQSDSEESAAQQITNSALLLCLKLGECHFDRLLDAAENDYLSSSFDLGVLETFTTDLAAIMKLGETTAVGQKVSGVHLIDSESDYGILPPVMSASMRMLASLAVQGLCKAGLTENASVALSTDVWNGLWLTASHINSRLPFGRASTTPQTECLSSGFGFLKLIKKSTDRKPAEEFISMVETAIKRIQDELYSTTECALADISGRLNEVLPNIGHALEKLEKMCGACTPPSKSAAVSPWQEAIENVLTRVCGVTEVEEALLQAQSSQQRKEEEMKKTAEEMSKLREECNNWRTRVNELGMKIERMSLYEKEAQGLRASDAHYVRILGEQRVALDGFEKQKKAFADENAALSSKLKEMTAVLESTKQLSRHQYQSEWDAMEIANLRSINSKLERELLALQMEGVDDDLNIQDLALFLPLSDAVESDALVAPSATSPPDIASAVGIRKVVDDYRVLRSSIFHHILKVPLFNPISSEDELAKEQTEYMAEHSALRLKLSVLQTRMDLVGSETYDNLIPAQRFMRTEPIEEETRPVGRITIPNAPWHTGNENVCKLSATNAQLSELNALLIGSF